MTAQWTLTADERQFRIIVKALNLFSRLLMGQIEELDNFFRWESCGNNLRVDPNNYEAITQLVEALKPLIFPELPIKGSYGIHSPEISDESKIAFDLIQVIRHRLAWDAAGNPSKRRWPDMMQVDYDEFMPCSTHPKAQMDTKSS